MKYKDLEDWQKATIEATIILMLLELAIIIFIERFI